MSLYGTIAVEMEEQICTCGVPFAVPKRLAEKCREVGGAFFCPVGHSLVYGTTALSTEEALHKATQKQLAAARKDLVAERVATSHAAAALAAERDAALAEVARLKAAEAKRHAAYSAGAKKRIANMTTEQKAVFEAARKAGLAKAVASGKAGWGPSNAKRLPAERSASAKKAAEARWSSKKHCCVCDGGAPLGATVPCRPDCEGEVCQSCAAKSAAGGAP